MQQVNNVANNNVQELQQQEEDVNNGQEVGKNSKTRTTENNGSHSQYKNYS